MDCVLTHSIRVDNCLNLPKIVSQLWPKEWLNHLEYNNTLWMMTYMFILKWDSNLGLSMSHRLNYEAAALTTQPPRLDNFDLLQNCKRWIEFSILSLTFSSSLINLKLIFLLSLSIIVSVFYLQIWGNCGLGKRWPLQHWSSFFKMLYKGDPIKAPLK